MAFDKSEADKGDQRREGGPMLVPLLPLRDIVVFPHMVVPLFVGREKSVRALEEAMERDRTLLLSAQRDARADSPDEEGIYSVGTVGSIVQLVKLPDGMGP
jgi:ATP-dependent Lon protease